MVQPELNQEDLLRRITNRIRQSLELQEILDATVAEIRSLLGSDRVMVYRFDESGSGEVIAESIRDNCLPTFKGLKFPADDIPEQARQSYLKDRVRSIVDVSSGTIGISPVDSLITAISSSERARTGQILEQLPDAGVPKIHYRPVDPCHAQYLTAMGVQSSMVLPVVHYDIQTHQSEERLWGLLVSHQVQPRSISQRELQILQSVVDQVSIAIAQSALLSQTRQQHVTEATINQVSTLLHSLPTIELQAALEETVAALQGVGGRLYIVPNNNKGTARVFTCGMQPKPTDPAKQNIEEHPVFSTWDLSGIGTGKEFRAGETGKVEKKSPSAPPATPLPLLSNPHAPCSMPSTTIAGCQQLVVDDLYEIPELSALTPAFESTPIRGMLVLPLYYRASFLGILSIFRCEIQTETFWAGRFNTSEKQTEPRKSFEVWREVKRSQSQAWTRHDRELGCALGHHFAMAIAQYKLYSQVQSLNTNLERQVEERTASLKQSLELSAAFWRVTNQIRSTLDLKTILQTIVREVQNLISSDRVAIYRFTADWESEAIVEAINGEWKSVLGIKEPAGCFLGESVQHYKRGHIRAIDDVSVADMAPYYRDLLEDLQIRANLIVPIGVGNQLWGLLMAQECKATRHWRSFEIELLQQLADQAAVAIQQAELYEKSRVAAATATAQAQKLSNLAQQQQALFGVITKIRESLDVRTIFEATTTEVRRLLDADRVAVFRFAPDCGYDYGEFVSEDVYPGLPQAKPEIQDYCFGEKYHPGWVQAIADIYKAGLNEGHIKILEQLQVRASLVVPLPKGEALWGLLCIHQCTTPRQWHSSEIEFARQIAAHLGVALQQAELLTRTQQQTEQLADTLQNLKKTQTQLIQTEKMSSLGQLVAGVAHEINNPVNFIYGNLAYTSQYARDMLELLHLYQKHYPNPVAEIVDRSEEIDLEFLSEDLPKILASLEMGAERIRKLVLSLRNFSRLDQAEMKPVDIHEGLDSTLLILQHRLKPKSNYPGIEIVKNYGELPLVECYASQLNQVFMNVLSNAIDALEEHDASRTPQEIEACKSQIAICTSIKQVSIEKKGSARNSLFSAEVQQEENSLPTSHIGNSSPSTPAASALNTTPTVVIQITDNGPGISQALLSQIFDPFFTTKPIGKGTGLGLSISYQIVVEKHGGIFQCFSQPGEGTQFWIEIPIRRPQSVQ